MSSYTKKGVIDENGTLIYTAHNDVLKVYGYDSDNLAYYTTETGDVVVDENGQEHLMTQKTEEESVSICGHGNGVFILRKDIANYTQKASYVSVVDAEGNIIFDEQELPKGSDVLGISNYVSAVFTYYGEGIFRSNKDILGSSYTAFLNSNTGAVFWDKYDSLTSKYGKFYIRDRQAYFFDRNAVNPYYDRAAVVSAEIVSTEDAYFNWYESLTRDDFVEYRVMPAFPNGVSVSEYGTFDEDLAPVVLSGADGRYYITVVNRDGEQQYEPIKLPELKISIPGRGRKYIFYEGGKERDFSNYNAFGDQYRGIHDLLYAKGKFIYWEDGNTYLVDAVGNKASLDVDYEITSFDGKYIYMRYGVYNTETKEPLYALSIYGSIDNRPASPSAEETTIPDKTYAALSDFSIEGKWKNIGQYTFGQVSSGAIVAFDGTHCNVVSPQDTYAIYKSGDNYRLDCTTLLGETLSFTVKTVDKDNIDIYYGSNYLEVMRVD